MNRTFALLVPAFLVILCLVPATHAQQKSFSIAPPPLAYPSFEEGKTDLKLGATFVTMSGNGVEFTGGGLDFIARRAFTNVLAGDLQVGVFGIGGTIRSGTAVNDASYGNLYLSGNAEVQAVKSGGLSAILFVGPNLTLEGGSMEYSCGTGRTCTATLQGSLYGVQGGIQIGIAAGDLVLAPFATVMNQQGSTTVTAGGYETTTTIDPYTTTSLGLDVVYVPWHLSLSAVLQEAERQTSKDQEGVKTTIIQLSWHF